MSLKWSHFQYIEDILSIVKAVVKALSENYFQHDSRHCKLVMCVREVCRQLPTPTRITMVTLLSDPLYADSAVNLSLWLQALWKWHAIKVSLHLAFAIIYSKFHLNRSNIKTFLQNFTKRIGCNIKYSPHYVLYPLTQILVWTIHRELNRKAFIILGTCLFSWELLT